MGGEIQSPRHQKSPTGGAFSHRSTAANRRKFPEGTPVEVRTDEEDFKGVYFSATVVTPRRKNGRKCAKKLYVEYHDLLVNEEGLDRLREYVNVSFVRPRPPLLDTDEGFEPDDVVDAFHKDGWWTGTVVREVDGGKRFVVTFADPPDELEFGLSELRGHWDWVNGSWVRPQKQSMTGLMFNVGRKVEVSFDREDLQEAWFPSTIYEDTGDGTFLVDYSNASTNTDGPCTNVRVDSLHIRPCPPLLKDNNFALLEKVDAFIDFGWWSGVVMKHLENCRYQVSFENMKCEKEFNQSELRPHMQWKDGKWFTSFQPREPANPFLDDGVCKHLTRENTSASVATAQVKNSMDGEDKCGNPDPSLISEKSHSEPLISDNLTIAEATTLLTKRKDDLSDSGEALSQPHKKLKKINAVGDNKEATHDGSEKEVISDFGNPESSSNMEKSVAQTKLDQSYSHPWEQNVQRKQRNSRTPQNVAGNKRSGAKILTFESLEIDVGEKEPDTEGNTDVATQNEHEKREIEIPVIGSPCAETGSSESLISGVKKSQLSKIQEINDSISLEIKDGKQSGTVKGSEKGMRGEMERPKRILAEGTETLLTGNAENESMVSNRKDDDSKRTREEVASGMEASVSTQKNMTASQNTANVEKTANGQFATRKRKAGMTKRILAGKRKNDKVMSKVCPSWKRGRKQISSGKISVTVRDLVGASGGKPGEVNRPVEVENVIQTNNEFDNEPLSKWIEGMQISSAIDDSNTAVQCIVNSDNQGNGGVLGEFTLKPPEIERHSFGLVDRGDTKPSEPGSSPPANSTIAVVLDEATHKQSESGTQSLPSFEDTSEIDLLDQDIDKLPENEAIATTMVDDSSRIPNQSQSSAEKTIDTLLDDDKEKQPENEAMVTAMVDVSSRIPNQSQSSVEKMIDTLLDEDNEKQPENEAIATAMVDDSTRIPNQSQSSAEKTIDTLLDEDNEKQPENEAIATAMIDDSTRIPNQSKSSAEKTIDTLLDEDNEKQLENEAIATAMVDDSTRIPNQSQSSVEKTIDTLLDEDNEKQPENGSGTTFTPASVDTVVVVPSEPENPPFSVKNLILWKTIESMEVFKKMPQKPHFQPLKNLKESSREGVAIGYMVTFCSLVEQTSKLQITDPISTILDLKESFLELEKHGFDIRAVEDCINQLFALKHAEEKFVNDTNTLNSQITEHNKEKTRMETEIEELNKQITTLQKKLSLAKSVNEKEDKEIAFLQDRRREIKDSIENVKSDFKGIVSSIL